MKKLLIQFLVNIICVAFCAGLQAQIYKWVDDEGNVHFGDRPSQETQTEEISDKLPELNVSEGSNTGYTPSGESSAERRERIRAEQNEEKLARKPACDEARKELRIISGPVYFTNDDGSDYTISETERAELERSLRADIDRYCD